MGRYITMVNHCKKGMMLLLAMMTIIAACLLAGCGSSTDSAANELWGRADAKEIDINSKVAGRVVQLLVKEGDVVKKGQVIAYVDKRDLMAQRAQLQANIKALEAQQKQASVVTTLEDSTSHSTVDTANSDLDKANSDLDLARSDYERFQALVESGAVSKQTFDAYRTKYEVAQSTAAQAAANVNKANAGLLQTDVNLANEEALAKKLDSAVASLEQLDVSIDETEIKAPYDGIVTAKYIEEGSMYTVPAFIFGGYTWPIESMGVVTSTLAAIFPMAYLSNAVRYLFLSGSLYTLSFNLSVLCLMGCVFGAVAYYRFPRHIKKNLER